MVTGLSFSDTMIRQIEEYCISYEPGRHGPYIVLCKLEAGDIVLHALFGNVPVLSDSTPRNRNLSDGTLLVYHAFYGMSGRKGIRLMEISRIRGIIK